MSPDSPDGDARSPITIGIGFVLALTAWRVGLLAFDHTDLFLDETQYWLWGQHLAFGYYSKPPLIAWIIRASTALAGSDAPFWVRLPAPLFHMATALVLMGLAARLWGARVGAWTGAVYGTLPFVDVGSALISTDTPMLFFYALAVAAYMRLIERPSRLVALGLGGALGLGLLAKYAMIYFLLGAGLAAAFIPSARISWRDAGLALGLAVLIMAPNLGWNYEHGATTFLHTADNVERGNAKPDLARMGRFALGQLVVFGPVLMGAYLAAVPRALSRGGDPRVRLLVVLSLPVIALMCVQAYLAGANGNWAVVAYVGGALIATRWLLVHAPRLLKASQALHLVVALALPLTLVFAYQLTRPDGRLLYKRFLGRRALSLQIRDVALANGLGTIVARDRGVLADLFYTLRGQPFQLYALPRPGFAASYYEQEFPLPVKFGAPVLYVATATGVHCSDPASRLLGDLAPARGTYAGRRVVALHASPACIAQMRKTLKRDTD